MVRHELATKLLRICGLLLALAVAVASASGCAIVDDTTAAGSTVPGDRKVKVTTTTNFITDTVRRIGGDRVEVTGLMGPGIDPHLYKASARDVNDLRDADVIFYGGLHLEGKMAELFDRLAERQTTTAVFSGIPEADLIVPDGAPADEPDPHVWFDVRNWKAVARTVAATLKRKDPSHAAEYDARLAAYLRELDATDAYVRERIAEIPQASRVLITSHDAFEYFGRRYGMDVEGIQGVSTVAEATTADVQRVAELIADRGVKAVFVESSVPRQTIDAVLAAAREQGAEATVGGELYTDAAGDEGTPEGTYTGMVRANADTIAEGLR
jgi:manganese/zinc/iron transport system substrate-binding protein